MSSQQVNNVLFWWFVGAAIYDRFLWTWAKAQVGRYLRRYAAREMPPPGSIPLRRTMPALLNRRMPETIG
jgi:hypothetical protein